MMHQAQLAYGDGTTIPEVGDQVLVQVPSGNRARGAHLIFPHGLRGTITQTQDHEGLVTVRLADPWFFEKKGSGWINARGRKIGQEPPHAFVYTPGTGKGMKVVSAIPVFPHMLVRIEHEQGPLMILGNWHRPFPDPFFDGQPNQEFTEGRPPIPLLAVDGNH